MTAPPIVVVTGAGAVTAAGPTLDESWRGVLSGRTFIGPVAAFDCAAYGSQLAGEARDFDPGARLGARRARRLDRCHQLALAAAREALEDARVVPGTFDPRRAAIVFGTSLAGMAGGQAYERERLRRGAGNPRLLYDILPHSALERLAADTGFRGARMVFSTACTSSTVAIAYAAELLRNGRADIVLTGGADPLAELSFAGFSSMGNLSTQPCAPFSAPSGLTIGEGAGVMVLEREEGARARGVRPRARLLGYGLSADAFHATSGDPTGRPQLQAVRAALRTAGVAAADVSYVNAHGTGTAGNDPIETRTLRLLFDDGARVPVSSLKGTIGHTLGAAGATEAVLTVMAVERQTAPPTANFTTARRDCDLDYVPNAARPVAIRNALSLNFAFGGNNAALLFGAADGPPPAPPAAAARRVVVTGLGIVSPIGSGVGALREALSSGRSGVAPIRRFDVAGLGARLGAVVTDFGAVSPSRADLRRADRLGAMVVSACTMAFDDAGLRVTAENQYGMGIVQGTAIGPLGSAQRFFEPVAAGGGRRTNPATFPNTVYNASTGLAAAALRLRGPNLAVSAGQASGLAALACGCDLVRGGTATALIAGGGDELEPATLAGFAAVRRISPHETADGEECCAPFRAGASGMVLGEGCVFLVLEALESAVARNARIHAEVLGWAGSGDRPVRRGADGSGEGMAQCIEAALDHAGVSAAEIDAVGSGAMSSPFHDRIEARALRRVLGGHRPPVTAFADRVGVSAASAPLSAAAVLLGMAEGFVPGSPAAARLDPDCDVDLYEGSSSPADVGTALVTASALGGSNYALVLRRWPR